MLSHGLTFDEALQATRTNAVFTTHTPVPAGIDRFPLDLIDRYFGSWANEVGLSMDDLHSIGHRPADHADERFNMAVMGMRLAERRNGVAALHGEVSREMFADLWPDVPIDEIPVGSITNGVHGSTWTSPEIDELYTEAAGPGWSYTVAPRWEGLSSMSDEHVWAAHRAGTHRLVEFCRDQLFTNGLQRGVSASELAWTAGALDPDALTICFARRFATYKRATLLLSQPERLFKLLLDEDRPVQFVFAGKAHPADDPGKELIREIVSFSHDPAIRHRFCFVDDYDMGISRHLLQGADVWLNTPLRPQEACGTSGMKAAMNGALNCSVLDGWWDECFRPGVGWAISSAETVADPVRRDEIEANSLFELLEQQIIPLFYDRPGPGAPSTGWVRQMTESMSTVAPFVSSARMVADYVTVLYGPASASSARLSSDGWQGARELSAWRRRMLDEWHNVHIDEVEVDESVADLATARTIGARVALGSLHPDEVEVQVVSGLVGQSGELEGRSITPMRPDGELDDGHVHFTTELLLDRAGRRGVTIRVVPRHRLLHDALEFGRVAWASD
jgi:starch phosphorylase